MINPTHNDLRLRSRLIAGPLLGTVYQLTGPPGQAESGGDEARSFWALVARISRRTGVWLFAAADMEAIWRGWEIHERWLGLKRRYRDPRFGHSAGQRLITDRCSNPKLP